MRKLDRQGNLYSSGGRRLEAELRLESIEIESWNLIDRFMFNTGVYIRITIGYFKEKVQAYADIHR